MAKNNGNKKINNLTTKYKCYCIINKLYNDSDKRHFG